MPGFIKTARDEEIWQESKRKVEKSKGKSEPSFTDQDWGLVNKIFQESKKKYKGKSLPKKYHASFLVRAAKLNQHDKDAALDFLSSGVGDQDFHKFEDDFNAAYGRAELKTLSPQEAKETMHRSHSMDFAEDPHSRGDPLVEDPSIVVSFKGKLYVIDGQHRMASAIKENRDVKVLILNGDFLTKYGFTEKKFAGKILR